MMLVTCVCTRGLCGVNTAMAQVAVLTVSLNVAVGWMWTLPPADMRSHVYGGRGEYAACAATASIAAAAIAGRDQRGRFSKLS